MNQRTAERTPILFRRVAGVALVIAAVTALVACAPNNREAASVTVTAPLTSEDDLNNTRRELGEQNPPVVGAERDSSLFYYKLQVCIQNKTSSPVVLEWNDSMLDDTRSYLKPEDVKKTLGPDAFACAFTYATNQSEEYGGAVIDGNNFSFWNGDLNTEVYSSSFKDTISEPNYVYVRALRWPDRRPFDYHVSSTLTLETFNKITAYPLEMRLYDPPSN